MLRGAALTVFILLSGAFCQASDAPEIMDLVYPELTDRESILVRGTVDGTAFEQRHPVAEQPGDYTLTVRAQDLAGRECERVIRIRKVKSLPPDGEIIRREFYIKEKAGSEGRPAPEPPGRPSARTLEGDYALILSISDGYGHRSSQVLTPKRSTPVPVIWKGRIREVWTLIHDRASGVWRALGTRVRGWVAPTALPPRSFKPPAPSPAKPLLSHEKTPAALPAADGKDSPIYRMAAQLTAEERSGLVSETAAVPEEEPVMEGGLNYTETKVTFPDERGGMTITVDDYRKGVRTIVRRDQSGNEIERSQTKMPKELLKGRAVPSTKAPGSDDNA